MPIRIPPSAPAAGSRVYKTLRRTPDFADPKYQPTSDEVDDEKILLAYQQAMEEAKPKEK